MSYFYFMNNSSYTQMMGFIISDGEHTIIIDGGTEKDAENLLEHLKLCGRKIDAWFFTHPHLDHVDAFRKIASEKLIELPSVYCNFPPLSFVKKHSTRDKLEYDTLEAFYKLCPSYNKINKGDIFTFGKIKIEVMRVFNPEITCNTVNSSSAVFKVSDNKSLLILGDLSAEGGHELMSLCTPEQLKCDYIQLSHHGQNGVDFEFYEYIRPEICLWSSPEWLYNNDTGNGFDTAPFKTVRTREWMENLGAKEHYVAYNGPHKLEL